MRCAMSVKILSTVETSCVTKPQQIAVVELEGYSWSTCSKQRLVFDEIAHFSMPGSVHSGYVCLIVNIEISAADAVNGAMMRTTMTLIVVAIERRLSRRSQRHNNLTQSRRRYAQHQRYSVASSSCCHSASSLSVTAYIYRSYLFIPHHCQHTVFTLKGKVR